VSRRFLLALALVLVTLPVGCVFGGDMTAEELEGRVAHESPLATVENVECREGVVWEFECTYTQTQGLMKTLSNEMTMGFNFDGDDVECGTGPLPAASVLPSPSEICPQMAR
jgi:hypothetical protein